MLYLSKNNISYVNFYVNPLLYFSMIFNDYSIIDHFLFETISIFMKEVAKTRLTCYP
jgi:hypothetical protein